MAQTAGYMSGVAGKVELSTNNSDWVDYSGFVSGISFSGYDRKTGEAYTFDGDEAAVGFGKLEPSECTIKMLYTNGSTDPFAVVLGQHQTAGGGSLFVRWSPQGGDTTGEDKFTSKSPSKVISLVPPEAEAESGDPLIAEFTIKTPGWSATNAT